MLKKLTAFLLFFTMLTIGIPCAFCFLFTNVKSKTPSQIPLDDSITEIVETWNEFNTPKTIKSFIVEKNEVCEINFEEYIKGVVAAEMPATFEDEALKAQAVAARSYILNKIQTDTKHENGADICNNPSHCKAYSSKEELQEKWGNDFDKFYEKISKCIDDTNNCVMIYDNKIVNALFHSTSSGRTENAKDIWGENVDYLVSVASFGDELSPRYKSSVTMSIEEFKQILKNNYPQISWPDGSQLIGEARRSEAGGIISMDIANITLSGNEIRNIFSLRSTNITFDITDCDVTLNVVGNGHGVGMSQYGANYLATQGKTYIEILKTYYSGVEVVKLASQY